MEEKGWEDISDGWTGSGMTSFGDIDRSNGIDSEPMSDVLIQWVIDLFFDFFLTTGSLVGGFAWSASFSSSHKICFLVN